MSGVEAAVGLAVGVLPLLISAAEHYDLCLRPFTRYKTFSKEADRYLSQLRTQKVIFKNQCRILLEDIIDHDAASSMLTSGKGHPLWSDVELESKLRQLLSESRDACISTIEMIEEHLQNVESEAQDLENAIDQDSQVCHKIPSSIVVLLTKPNNFYPQDPSDPIGSKPRQPSIAKKMRFAFSKPRLDKPLLALRSLNDDFRTLSTQILKSNSLTSQRHSDPSQKSHQEVERYKAIRQASRQVYEALGKACTKHTEHEAHFCVEVEEEITNGNHGAQVKFRMAYGHLQLAGTSETNNLIWFVVGSTSGGTGKDFPSNLMSDSTRTFRNSLKRQINSSACSPQTKAKKSVRFESSVAPLACAPSLPNTAIANVLISNDQMRKDFCDLLRKRLRDHPQASECVGVLENSASCKNFVYPPPAQQCHPCRQAITLGQLISTVTRAHAVGKISLYDRLRLAKTLAITVLQYHATPWLKETWRSEDVYFFRNASTPVNEIPNLSSPHLNVKLKEPCEQVSCASAFPAYSLARNPLLFGLGVILLEIAYTSTLENLQSSVDLENGQANRYTEFFTARRLAKTAKTDMGGKYHKVVEKLVECDFGCGTNLNDTHLQAAFHDDVIRPLETLEKKLHDFHFD